MNDMTTTIQDWLDEKIYSQFHATANKNVDEGWFHAQLVTHLPILFLGIRDFVDNALYDEREWE